MLFRSVGLPTTMGVRGLLHHRAARDAVMATMLRESGAVILGRTNLSQTMLFAESRNPIYGQTANPFSLDHTPGGSSGGEAAAIAAGLSPLGVGTDIGGSIRTPCSFTGIVGFKPTLDRLPSRGQGTILKGQEAVRSQCGPMARTVADLDLFFRAMDPARRHLIGSEVLQRVEASLQKAMATPAIKERVATMGATPGVLTAAGFTQVIRNEVRRWAPKTGAAGGAGAAVATTAAVAPKP